MSLQPNGGPHWFSPERAYRVSFPRKRQSRVSFPHKRQSRISRHSTKLDCCLRRNGQWCHSAELLRILYIYSGTFFVAVHGGLAFTVPGYSEPRPQQPVEKNGFVGIFGCHWLCQCRAVAGFSTLAKPVAHFFQRAAQEAAYLHERLL